MNHGLVIITLINEDDVLILSHTLLLIKNYDNTLRQQNGSTSEPHCLSQTLAAYWIFCQMRIKIARIVSSLAMQTKKEKMVDIMTCSLLCLISPRYH